jgi:hypothetical protein
MTTQAKKLIIALAQAAKRLVRHPITVSTVCFLAAGSLGYVLFVRYGPKDPFLSILSTPDALQGDDAPHWK